MAKKKPAPTIPQHAHIAEDLRRLATPVDGLIADPNNTRTHERNIPAIAASLSKFGQVQPLLCNGRNKQVVIGNGRLAAAISLGWTHIAVIWQDLTAKQQARLSLADNRTAELAGWDEAKLALLIADVEEDDPDLAAALLLAELGPIEAADEEEQKDGGSGGVDTYEVVITCKGEADQKQWFERLQKEGAKCRLLTL